MKRELLWDHVFGYMLMLVNREPIEIIDNDKWRFDWTLTREEKNRFSVYTVKLIMKSFRCNKSKAVEAFELFYSNYGLRIKG